MNLELCHLLQTYNPDFPADIDHLAERAAGHFAPDSISYGPRWISIFGDRVCPPSTGAKGDCKAIPTLECLRSLRGLWYMQSA